MLLKYNIHKEKHIYSIAELNKYLQTENIRVTSVQIKIPAITRTSEAPFPITPQVKKSRFINFLMDIHFYCH